MLFHLRTVDSLIRAAPNPKTEMLFHLEVVFAQSIGASPRSNYIRVIINFIAY